MEAFLEASEQAWRASSGQGPISEAEFDRWRTVLDELRQPAGEPPALLPRGLVRGPRALAFEYGMFLGRIALALLFVATSQAPFLWFSLLLFWLDLYVVEPVVFKLHLGAMNVLLDVRGHQMADCRGRDRRPAPPAIAPFASPSSFPSSRPIRPRPSWPRSSTPPSAARG